MLRSAPMIATYIKHSITSSVRGRVMANALTLLSLTLIVGLAGCAPGGSSARGATSVAPPLTIAVLGASDAWGVGSQDPDRLNWPSVMAADLERPVHLINLGAPGVTLAQARREEEPVALDERPDVIVIWLAVNDIIAQTPLSAYKEELNATLSDVRERAPQARVFVGNVPDLTQIPYFNRDDPKYLVTEVAAWNDAIAQACAANGATVVDIHATWDELGGHPEYISDDGLHPSQAGADALARVFSVAIEVSMRALGQRQSGEGIGE